ncbi:MAG: hypothetical protein HPY74_13250 [Firmicutes bacterium]|nr:hypothetical protein [Bacillota bacterium]
MAEGKIKKNTKQKVSDSIRNRNIGFKYIAVSFFILFSVSGFLLILYSTSKYGPASTHDSVAYMYAAESLLKGKGLVYFGYDTPYVQWPPLYPVLLSGISLLGHNLLIAAGYLNGFIFALIIFFSGYWLLKGTGNCIISITGSIAVLASIPLTYVSKFIWSEPLFILLLLLFMISLDNYIYKSSLRFLIEGALFAALACLTRYIGITIIITGCILLLIQQKKFINRFVETVIFGFISSTPAVLWITRNYLLFNTLTGGRPPAQNTFDENITITFKTLASWFAPDYSESIFYVMLALLVSISVITIIKNFYESVGQAGQNKNRVYRIIIPLVFSFVYVGYLIISASAVAFDSINSRLLVPVYVPLIMTIFFTLNDIIALQNGKIRNIVIKCLFIVFYSIWLLYPISEITVSTRYSHEKGAGILASEWWINSGLMDYIRKLPGENRVYSNFPDAVYIHTGKKAGYTPKKEGLAPYGLDKFKKSVENSDCIYIAWFNMDTINNIYCIDELKDYFTIQVVEKFPDGVIYKITGLRGFYNE